LSNIDPVWSDPRLIYTVAVIAVVTMLATIWLFRRSRRSGRQAGVICLLVSIILHVALIFLVPYLNEPKGGSVTAAEQTVADIGVDTIEFSSFDPDMMIADAAGEDPEAVVAPLPVADLHELLSDEVTPAEPVDAELLQPMQVDTSTADQQQADAETPSELVPETLSEPGELLAENLISDLDRALGELLESAAGKPTQQPPAAQFAGDTGYVGDQPSQEPTIPTPDTSAVPTSARAPAATVPGEVQNDFANRTGEAKELALNQTGGNADTEAAVAAALRFLAAAQRRDGAWDPNATGAGVERAPLGENRGGAGSRAETAITGLALLTMMGAGNTHAKGDYADNVYRGLAYLIRNQKPDGSLAGKASPYAATYSHGMAALAMCEAAATTQDPAAVTAAQRAIAYTTRLQHPSTGGWRYLPGDPGDLSQLGWQAMVLDAGHRAKVPVDRRSVAGVQRFLRSVRTGSHGGLAGYRAGEAPSRTMTAEALATRLLIGEQVPPAEIEEAERYILQQQPGQGQDNLYYWYYATLALHQLQDDAWQQWNQALQQRLLATQRSDGSWPTTSLWGGYGGSAYTTSMAALCLESYYRHTVRGDRSRIAALPDSLR
jgi:hypothetical protein